MRTTPHSRSTTWTWGSKASKPNSYSAKATAYQSPLLAGESLSPLATSSKTLLSFTQGLSEATLVGEGSIFDFSDVPLAHEDLPKRAAPLSGAR